MRRVIAWLCPACAGSGTQGLPIPDPVNFRLLAKRGPVLAAPAEYAGSPDFVTAPYPVAGEILFAALLRVGAERPNTWLAAAYPTLLQAHYVVRGGWIPMLLVVGAVGVAGGSVPLLLARGMGGLPGFGAPRRQVKEWLTALNAVLKE